jgi:hypothetical protein
MRLFWSSLAVAALSWGLMGCGGAEAPDDNASSSSSSGASGGENPSSSSLDVTLKTGDFEVPPGDSFECFYTDVTTDKELSVVSATGHQGPGGHHIVAYYTDVSRAATHHPCEDAEMVSWHQVAGGNVDTSVEGLVELPEGLAVKVPAGKQLVVQAHYINTSGAAQMVNDAITIHVVKPEEVKAYANYFVAIDGSFEVPPQGSFTRTSTCTVGRDLTTVLLLGHMHEWGKHYKLERLDGDAAETLYETEWVPTYTSHPPVKRYTMDQPLTLKQGTKLRQTCEWNNTTADTLLFPREMCIAFFYYFPDVGALECEMEMP